MPLHNSRVRARIHTAVLRSKSDNRPNTKGNTFASTKVDKRRIKHSSFVSRIEKPSQNSKKRRRPSKNPVANLESLGDALPELDGLPHDVSHPVKDGAIRHKSLKSRPGAMKKKAELERLERERFNQNMAQLAHRPAKIASPAAHDASADNLQSYNSKNSWQALRHFITSSLDQ